MLSEEFLIGQVIGDYRIVALLSHGGMSEVFRAEHRTLRRPVALKVLTPLFAENPGFRDRFLKESRAAASIDHPNIVPIYEAGESDGLLFIAMQLVEGVDLGKLLRVGPLDPRRTTDIVTQAAAALDAAHRRGLVHRDVKPGNLLVMPAPEPGRCEHVYLADFGVSRRLASVTRFTETGELVGTVNYVAPEQIEGREVDGRADVYSLGCVAFECLTGEPPYRSTSDVGVLWGHVQGRIPLVVEQRADLPEEVEDVIAGALAKSPEKRYPTAGHLARALSAALGVGGRRRVLRRRAAPVPPAPGRSREPRMRSIARVARIAAIVAALAVGVPVAVVLGQGVGVLGPRGDAGIEHAAPTGPDLGGPSPSQRSGSGGDEGREPRLDEGRLGGARVASPPRAGAENPPGVEGVRNPLLPRTVYRPYRFQSSSLIGGSSAECRPQENLGCVDVQVRPGETLMSVLIVDDNYARVRAVIRENIDGDPAYERTLGEICVRTRKPLAVTPGATINILLQEGTCGGGGTSSPTEGTISVIFEREG